MGDFATPNPGGVHHITFRVADIDRTARFFKSVLGWTVDTSASDKCRIHMGDMRIVFRNPLPGGVSGDRFDETRIGVDHVSLHVGGMEELRASAQRLQEAGVATEGVRPESSTGGQVVVFRDPDNIQWELYAE
jgi:glyoxylase I family protein